ncbi:BolA family protein [Legionella sp. CNM-4043-24]|uniref:BolA family protein n=1 Tax=Legionella sp. CNM-4043-24 TaxID=3421646 RepID=UPI00403B0400
MLRKQRMHETLTPALMPQLLIIEDESHRHHVPTGAESHFKLTVVSELFEPMTRIQRHRLLNSLLADEFDKGLHALSMHLFSPAEWQTQEEKTPRSPACRDGFNQDRSEK